MNNFPFWNICVDPDYWDVFLLIRLLVSKARIKVCHYIVDTFKDSNLYVCCRAVPKFIKRIKVRDYKDRNVFGVPLQVIVQRTGQPLPQGIQQAMRYLRNQCLDQVTARYTGSACRRKQKPKCANDTRLVTYL